MDLIGYDQARYEAIVADYRAFAAGIGVGVFFALFSLLLGDFFQNRILLELLFHQGLELQGRGLQQSQ